MLDFVLATQQTGSGGIALERPGVLEPVSPKQPEGDFFVRSGPGTVKLPPDSAVKCVHARFGGLGSRPEKPPEGAA